MTNEINITIYYTGTILVYAVLLLLILYNIYPYIHKLFISLSAKLSLKLNRFPKAQKVYGNLKKLCSIPLIALWSVLLKISCIVSGILAVIESNIVKSIVSSAGNVLDYTALIIRKCYDMEYRHSILITVSVIVVFYIILTVF